MSQVSYITIKGAREHNLKNINLSLPRDKLIVLTGLSGCGKSSLAFDTIYAEGQRRYVESLSSYARQFLQLQDKPDVDLIEGLSPSISIEQKTTSKNPRSTVGTVTEIYDYLRLLFARVGKPYCYECEKPISQKSASSIVDEILNFPKNSRISILSPIIRAKKGEHKNVLEELKKEGFLRVRVDGELKLLEEDFDLNPKVKHTIELVVDRLSVIKEDRGRISDAVELSLKKSKGLLVVLIHGDNEIKEEHFSEAFGCMDCGTSMPPLEPRMFSFNAPQGACENCLGLGYLQRFSEDKLIDKNISLEEGCIIPYRSNINGYYYKEILRYAKSLKIDTKKSYKDFSLEERDNILYELISSLDRRYKETESEFIKEELENYMSKNDCSACNGSRLKKEARFVKVYDKSISDIVNLSIKKSLKFFKDINFSGKDEKIAQPILKEIRARLSFLEAVGLDYLNLSRSAKTLSGGETQRIRLATQIGSALVGVLYVLDEPSIGLHQRDNEKLINTLKHLRDLGNTVLVVEHDEDTIWAADHVVDMGPGAGKNGGMIVAEGSPKEIAKNKNSLTGKYLNKELSVSFNKNPREGNGKFITIKNARGNNLKNVNLKIPLGKFVAVTGVSGSGKSSLILDTLYAHMAQIFNASNIEVLPHDGITGLENIDKVIDIDQTPIGRTPRSNPVTYTGTFDLIRSLFSLLPESKMRGYNQGRFSFNVKGGRCEHCKGDGVMRIEMNFLPDVYVSCEHCKGKRFNKDTLSITYKGKSISDILEMTVLEALDFFAQNPNIKKRLATLDKVGLSYIHLGQQATTLSGGEAQRVKLSKELSKRATGRTLYILDEPTTGLHFHDVKELLGVLNELCDQGNTILVIEHNLDVIKSSDHVIDLGPEGGDGGGMIVSEGTPQEIAKNPYSHTGRFLKKLL